MQRRCSSRPTADTTAWSRFYCGPAPIDACVRTTGDRRSPSRPRSPRGDSSETFFVYWYAVLCHHVGVRDYVVFDGDNPLLSSERIEDRRKFVRGHADDYLYCLGDPQGQAVQACMGLMAMVSGTADAKEFDPEELIDYLVEQLNAGQARRIAGTSSPLPKELLASIPAPGT